jgi:hypothetical protein
MKFDKFKKIIEMAEKGFKPEDDIRVGINERGHFEIRAINRTLNGNLQVIVFEKGGD